MTDKSVALCSLFCKCGWWFCYLSVALQHLFCIIKTNFDMGLWLSQLIESWMLFNLQKIASQWWSTGELFSYGHSVFQLWAAHAKLEFMHLGDFRVYCCIFRILTKEGFTYHLLIIFRMTCLHFMLCSNTLTILPIYPHIQIYFCNKQNYEVLFWAKVLPWILLYQYIIYFQYHISIVLLS